MWGGGGSCVEYVKGVCGGGGSCDEDVKGVCGVVVAVLRM